MPSFILICTSAFLSDFFLSVLLWNRYIFHTMRASKYIHPGHNSVINSQDTAGYWHHCGRTVNGTGQRSRLFQQEVQKWPANDFSTVCTGAESIRSATKQVLQCPASCCAMSPHNRIALLFSATLLLAKWQRLDWQNVNSIFFWRDVKPWTLGTSLWNSRLHEKNYSI